MHDDGAFGRRLRQLRKARDLTQEALAQAAFCALDTVKKIETGRRRPSRQLAAQLADVLGLGVSERAEFLAAARVLADQDAPGEAPPATTPSPPQRMLNNLPAQLTRFIGREHAITDVYGLLEYARLLTLTGSGGTGKTRLALEVAALAVPTFANGVWLVELAALSDGAMVADTVATVLGLPLARQPTLTMLVHYLRTKRLLLILDNCEHLILACAELADALLRTCPDLHILATSREGLGVAGELTWPVPTLQMPDTAAQPTLATLATFEAVRLFVDRAALVSPGFALTVANAAAVRQICTRLDGIPLAIELAAARVKTLAASDIAARLGDRFRLLTGGSRTVQPRHQTLRALIDWSYQLLTESERGVLRRLAIFAGGWTLEAAGAVCADDGIDDRDVLDVLTRLVDKSLVVPDPRSAGTRYTMLETIRQYLVEQLEAAEERAAIRGRHLDYMLAFSEHLAPQLGENELYGDWSAPQPGEEGVIDPVIAYTRLAADLENIRYALEWAAETGRIDAGLRILIALSTLFIMRAGEKELLARFQAMLEALAPPGDMRTHARACLWVVYLYHRKADIDQGRAWLDKAKTLIAQLDTPVLQFSLLSFWTSDAYIRGDYTLAYAYLEQQRNLAMAHDYFGRGKEDIEDALAWQHSYLLLLEHDYVQAKQRLQPSHARNVKLGNLYLSTALARLLGYALLYTGDVDEAAERFHESMRGNFALGDKQAVAACLSAVAAFALAHGELPRAARLFGASEALQEAIYTPVSTWDSEQVQRNVAILRQKLPSPELDAHWAAGRALSMEQAIDDALAMDP